MTNKGPMPTRGASYRSTALGVSRAGVVALPRYAPTIVVVAAVLWTLALAQTPFWPTVRYAAAFGWTVMVPGVLLQRRLLGPPATLAADLGYGGAIGLLYQLVGWALCVGSGHGRFILAWPLLVVAPAVMLARRRRARWRPVRYERPQPVGVSWAMVVVFLLGLRWYAQLPFSSALPDNANEWYKDEYYHLGLAGMFLHQVVPQVPQVAGEALHYHWFVHAHMAAMSLAGGVDLPLVVTRFYLLPLLAVLMWLFVAVLHDLTQSTWPGVLAFAMTVGGAALRLQDWLPVYGPLPLALHSPSQNFSLIVLLLILGMVLRWLRRGRLQPGEWLVLAVALFAGPGAKSSTLPIVFAGAATALLAAAVIGGRGRRLSRVGRPVLLALGVLLALVLTSPVLGGGGSGAHLQLFAVIRRTTTWGRFAGLDRDQQLFSRALVAPGVGSGQGLLFILLILLTYGVAMLWVTAGAGLLLRQRSVAAWFLAGVGLGGFAAMMVIDHPGLSEVYFMSQGVLAWHVLAAWGTWDVVRRARERVTGRRVGLIVVLAAAAGWILLHDVRLLTPQPSAPDRYIGDIALGLLPVVLLTGLLAWVLRRHPRRSSPVLFLGIVAALLGGAVIPLSWPGAAERPAMDSLQVTAAETEAARWLRDHSEPGQVVATNVHCIGLQQQAGCDARAFWVSGFSQRPVLVEGWGYTDQAQAAAGQDDMTFTRVPFFDPKLFALNESAFYHSDARIMRDMRSRGVVWLFADSHRRSKPMSKYTGRYATEVYRNPDVTIYRIENP